jgi:hypothetical protein
MSGRKRRIRKKGCKHSLNADDCTGKEIVKLS